MGRSWVQFFPDRGCFVDDVDRNHVSHDEYARPREEGTLKLVHNNISILGRRCESRRNVVSIVDDDVARNLFTKGIQCLIGLLVT